MSHHQVDLSKAQIMTTGEARDLLGEPKQFDRKLQPHNVPKFNPSVGDVYRVPSWGGILRVWRVTAVVYGSTAQESVVEMETLDRQASTRGPLRVPIDLMEFANPEKV